MPFNESYSNSILNYIFSKTSSLTPPASVYIGLSENDPEADNGTFNELSGGAYSRVLISQKGETYPDVIGSASNRTITNGKQINWTKATTDWQRANGFGLFSAPSGGTPFFFGKLELTDEQKAAGGLKVVAGAVALIDPQTLKITLPITATETE